MKKTMVIIIGLFLIILIPTVIAPYWYGTESGLVVKIKTFIR